MKVFKFISDPFFYAIGAKTMEEAENYLIETLGHQPVIDKIEKIPEAKWDEAIIEMYEDNNRNKRPFFISIREAFCGDEPQILYTNDDSLID